jgi:large subunit ribosomal protein L1
MSPQDDKPADTTPVEEKALVEHAPTAITTQGEKGVAVFETPPAIDTEEQEAQPKEKKHSAKAGTVGVTSSSNKKVIARAKKRGKKYHEKKQLVDPSRRYSLAEAIDLVKQTSYVGFDATIELHVHLGVDPRKADQQVRGTVVLPHGSGKVPKVLVFAEGEHVAQAKEAGADYIGGEDLVKKIEGGWLDFEVVVAVPEMMAKIAKLGKTLGTKGLMPNPKAGTVTADVGKAVRELKSGRIEYKVEKQPLIHTIFGKASFSSEQLKANLRALLDALIKAKPASSKGQYIQNAVINATMGPGIPLDLQEIRDLRA